MSITITASSTTNQITASSSDITLSPTTVVTGYAAGTLLDLSGTTFSVDLSELTDMTDAVAGGTDELVLLDNGAQKRKLFSEVGLSSFNNDLSTTITLATDNDYILGLRGNVQFTGDNVNDHVTTLYVVDPTADRTISLPDQSGTLALTASTVAQATLATITSVTDSTANTNFPIVFNNEGAGGAPGSTLLDDTGTFFYNPSTGLVSAPGLELISTDAGATVNPILSLYRNSSSPAASDDLGAIQFYGEDDGGNKTLYAQIHGFAQDETGGTEDGEIHFSCMAGASFEDPVMKLTKSSLELNANNDLILGQNSNIRFEGSTNNDFENTLYVEDPTADREVNLPDASGVLEIGALASGAVVTGTSIAHATFSTYKGQKIVFTGSSACTIGLPDAVAGDIGATWTICNAGSANIGFDLDASAAQTLKILTGASVVDVGTDNPHIIAGGVASLVCTAADNYILFGSGVVDN